MGVSGTLGVAGILSLKEIKELQGLCKRMSEKMNDVVTNASQLCEKLDKYYEDIDFSTKNFEPMQGSLSNEDRSHIFITLDSIYHACHYQHQLSLRWNIKVSEKMKDL